MIPFSPIKEWEFISLINLLYIFFYFPVQTELLASFSRKANALWFAFHFAFSFCCFCPLGLSHVFLGFSWMWKNSAPLYPPAPCPLPGVSLCPADGVAALYYLRSSAGLVISRCGSSAPRRSGRILKSSSDNVPDLWRSFSFPSSPTPIHSSPFSIATDKKP